MTTSVISSAAASAEIYFVGTTSEIVSDSASVRRISVSEISTTTCSSYKGDFVGSFTSSKDKSDSIYATTSSGYGSLWESSTEIVASSKASAIDSGSLVRFLSLLAGSAAVGKSKTGSAGKSSIKDSDFSYTTSASGSSAASTGSLKVTNPSLLAAVKMDSFSPISKSDFTLISERLIGTSVLPPSIYSDKVMSC